MSRSVVVVATCEQTPLMRVRATQSAIAIADHYRGGGRNVLVMIDSLTRLAMARRELGLLQGEPPSSRGYTPSVFQELANVIERLGNASVGGITALLTVLVDGGDLDEPVSDAVRGFVDGHIVLDRKIAERGFYPAIDVARSISRVASDVADTEHKLAARKFIGIEMLSNFKYDPGKNQWLEGSIYDGDSGKTYSCSLWFEKGKPNELRARGYIGIALLGRTEVFQRVTADDEKGAAAQEKSESSK
jgi:flagellar biosynthesis/type III secretory pathway ATPase